jgi:hypothetical protein
MTREQLPFKKAVRNPDEKNVREDSTFSFTFPQIKVLLVAALRMQVARDYVGIL